VPADAARPSDVAAPEVAASADPAVAAEALLAALDEAEVGRRHWVAVLTAGMGFFTDAYDLFIIGTVTVLLTPIFHLDTSEISLLNAISLLASVVGALLFGRLMDRLGRKAVYGLEIALLAVGAVLSGCAWDFWSLFAFRVLVGVGVGGDYATSAVITAEHATRRARGRLVGSVFAMQGFGLLAGPAIASAFLAAGVPTSLAWRIMLALGAVPALAVVYLRRRIDETPRYRLAMAHAEAAAAGGPGAGATSTPGRLNRVRLRDPGLRRRLIGTAGSWLLLDVAFYGNSVSSPLILKALQPHGSLLSHTLLSLAIFGIAAVPGYWLAVALLDRLGRRRIQWQGFAAMAVAFGLIAGVPGVPTTTWAFLLLFGVSYFFVEFGPNTTTFVYPSEIFPTSVRGTADGISAAGGKLGAFAGALLVPHLLGAVGISGVMAVMAGVSACGVLLTVVALPEPRGLSLEVASGERGPIGASGTANPGADAGSEGEVAPGVDLTGQATDLGQATDVGEAVGLDEHLPVNAH
jgi:MFS family permease